MIRLRNSMTRKVEEFHPIDPDHVRVYLCGPTVYDRAHLGNARNVILFDVLTRLLRHDYPRVTYVRNVTDVDDKINARAAETGRPIREITDETLGWYHEDMAALGNRPPDHEPRATEWIAQMVAMIETLIAKGNAYAAEGHVLFSVASDPDYGTLSNRSTDDMIAGARVEVAPYKRDPMDFVLWKPSSGEEPGWDSPWGHGRPGWHIECSAMSRELLGERFDVHGGGVDLIFPHHENEIAQSRCAHGGQMAQIWLHNEMLLVEGKKMSKSLGNFFTVRDLLDRGLPGEVIRFVFLMTHYSKPMDWTPEKAREAAKTLMAWRSIAEIQYISPDEGKPDETVLSALRNDLNTPLAISEMHRLAKEGRDADLIASASLLGLLGENLGWLKGNEESAKARLLDVIVSARQLARLKQDWARADQIRDGLIAAGVVLTDGKGKGWEIGPDFDPAKLEGIL